MNSIRANVKILQTAYSEVGMLLLQCLLVDEPNEYVTVLVVVAGEAAHQLRNTLTPGAHAALEYELLIDSEVGWLVRYAVRPPFHECLEMKSRVYGPPFENKMEYVSSGYIHSKRKVDSYVAVFPTPGYNQAREEIDLGSSES